MASQRADSSSARVASAPPAVRASFARLWQVPALVAGVLALVGVWASRPFWRDPEAWQFHRDMVEARRMLEDRHASANGAVARAADALSQIERFRKHAGEVHYLLGSAYLRLADQVPADRAAETRRQARVHLEQAQTLGVPDADRVRLLYRLGKVWYLTDTNLGQAASYLSQSIDEGAGDRFEGYGILAHVFVRLNNIPAALQAIEKQLQFPTEDENLLAGPRLLRGELLLHTPGPEAREAARKVLRFIGPNASPPILARARLLMAHTYQQDGAWEQAAPLWEVVLADHQHTPPDVGRIWYWLGCCYQNLGRMPKAMPAWQEALKFAGDEAQAAALQLGEAQLGAGNEAAARETIQRALAAVNRPEDFHNGLMGLAQARNIVQGACQAAMKKGSFRTAGELAGLYGKLSDKRAARTLEAEIAETWARAGPPKDANEEEAARKHFGEAAAAYEDVAQATADSALKSTQLWKAADAYLQAQDYNHAVSVLEQFVKLQGPEGDRLGEAWYPLGEAYEALGHDSAAVQSFLRCIGQPGPFAYRARYELAILKRSGGGDKGRAEAIQILQQNLELLRTNPEPDAVAQEKSLYALADLLYLSGSYRLAAESWEQALTIYPTNVYALEARWRLGECYRALANELQPIEPGLGKYLTGQARQLLEQAAANFQKVVDALEAQRARDPLPPNVAPLLYRSLSSLAEVEFALGQYDQATRTYETLASRYQQQYEGLQALKNLFRCQELFLKDANSIDVALGTLQKLSVVLRDLPDSIFRDRPEAQTREAWEKWIRDEESTLKKLQETLKKARPPTMTENSGPADQVK